MRKLWRNTIINWLIGLGACVIIGLIIGQLLGVLLLYVLGTLYWQLYQLYQFHFWLRHSGKANPPEAKGIWGEVFNSVYRLQKKQRKSKRRMQQALKRIENSTAALKEGVIMADHQGNLEWWNQSAAHFFGLMWPTDRGQAITNIVRSPDFFRYFSQKRFGEPLIIKSPSVDDTFLEIQTTLYDQNDHLIFIRDVTRMHLLEQMRTDFVANASHELKTPLTVIKGYLETLDMFKDDLPKSMQKGITNMTDQSERMEMLIEDLLLLSRLESDDEREEAQWLNILDIIRPILETTTSIASSSHEIKINIPADARVNGSFKELYSAFSNLIINAVKYSPDGGEITIEWRTSLTTDELRVSDSGVGIDPWHIPRLTERFYRVDKGRGSQTGGTGLGLAIVKHVLSHHDAKLDISSEPGEGSTFSCCFPINRTRPDDTPS
ncbi:phosphate regulon sensor histidine kinase PhoR [Marinomonas sp. C2222]|uniref:histidine kinase n=1 Tax=Marinomonas sargassi TaxID=2984494 RepID=A0ABT2YQC4_9GAMM|nr:phosphate regulon sensor histidine kinase PhoR [Marinomonas sargassi]MCV2402075.1 phosphate regulon sensor histidine kinase PhoR [Marinomonas sargassi]